MTLSEALLQSAVVQCARALGWLVYHTHDSRRSEPGFPDIVMVRGDRVVFSELKSTKGRLSEAQKEWLNALERAAWNGAEVYVWRPADWLSGAIEDVLRGTP